MHQASPDCYAFGQPLRKDGLFQLVAEEAFRDGSFDADDRELARGFLRYLDLAPDEVRRLTYRSRSKQRAGELGVVRPFHPLRLYTRVLRYLEAAPTEDEALIQRACRGVLEISERTHQNVLREARRRLCVTQNVPVLRLVPPAPPAPTPRVLASIGALVLGLVAGGLVMLLNTWF